MTSVLLATCDDLPAGDEDGHRLVAALAAHGVQAQWRSWTADATWDSLTVVRSTWDYVPRRAEFLRWARSVRTLWNPVEVLEWNSDKVYLAELAEAGVPITPTEWLAPGDRFSPPAHEQFVVKPSVGAGSRGAGRFRASDSTAAGDHVAALHDAGRTVLVQPYLAGVDVVGEAALIYLAGAYSHAITKGAMLPDGVVHPADSHELFVEERIAERTASAAERAVADAVVTRLTARFGPLLYARVDLLPTDDGPVVVEVEVSEPSLFLGYADGAADRFAAAIAART